MTRRGADLIVDALEAEAVELVFGYPGGTIMPFYDALVGRRVRHILCRHEQGAALAANGYARASGRVGVCVATSGPGATNLLTGLADALLDSVPMVAITGQVARPLMGTDAFQEVDVFGMSLAAVKHSFLLEDGADLPRVLAEAFRLARSGRPGPVLVDIPKDLQLASNALPYQPLSLPSPAPPSPTLLERARRLLASAERPLLYAGGGVAIADAMAALRRLVEVAGLPTVTTLKGIGVLPPEHPLNLGMLGMHGSRAANLAVQGCDLLLVAGARFDDRATGRLDGFAPDARVIHLDIDPAEIGKLRAADLSACCDLGPALEALAQPLAIEPWREQCRQARQTTQPRYDAPGPLLYAPAFLNQLSRLAPDNAIVCCDVGQHQMWVAQHYGFHHPRHHLSSGGLGTMGFGLPAAIGAQLAFPDRLVINVSGDGSFMMNVQELATIGRYRLPIKILLCDNSTLGMVKQWQELFFEQRYSETDLSDNPDFCRVAEAFGIPALRIERSAELPLALARLLKTPGPLLIHAVIDRRANVWPLVPPGADNATMLEQLPEPANEARLAV
ncbi:acetolactate synthase 2 catalytic subunit [Chitinimonas lacunae]|uniref:Acetolactate synthase n=1 Tax=Chitinimonas lacunae TaxID=1963018 RepID=A0ABV8MUD5_9NEIS